jgi:oligosaccharide 4-alpha-D-glucosyltransferase
MYEDDGASRTSLEDGRFELLQFTARQDEGSLAIALERHGNDYPGMPEYREVTIVIHNWTRDVACLRFGDTPLQLGRRPPARAGSAHYDRDSRRIQVKVSWEHGPAVLQIN